MNWLCSSKCCSTVHKCSSLLSRALMVLSTSSVSCCSSRLYICWVFSSFSSTSSRSGSWYRCPSWSLNDFYLPSKYLDIDFHLLPDFLWIWKRRLYSSLVHGFLLTSGFKWLYHLSRHCFPVLYLIWYLSLSFYEMLVQSRTPNSSTRMRIAWSSCEIRRRCT